MKLNVQQYLETNSLNQLKAEHGVVTSFKPGDYMFSLNYDQIESKPGPLTNECRGLILYRDHGAAIQSLDEVVGITEIMARPMDRFFNYGDPNACSISFNDPEVCYFEKLDGTLCILYWNPVIEEWHVATRSVPFADKPIDGFGEHTFRTLFERALFETLISTSVLKTRTVGFTSSVCFDMFTSQLSKDTTYCFELTTPMNRVVVEYKEFRVHLISIRDTLTGKEFTGNRKDLNGVPWCPQHKVNGIKELLEFVTSKNPTEHEGVVVMDRHFNRVKVKNAAYLAYNRAKNIVANSPRALLELILLEKIDDILPLLGDHLKEQSEKVRVGLKNLMRSVDAVYDACYEVSLAHPDNPRKYFALHAQALKTWMGPLMMRYLGKCQDCKDYIMRQRKEDGTWSDSFLDNLFLETKKHQ